MIILRCPRCGEDQGILQPDNTKEYREDYTEENCPKCRKTPKSPEQKLLDAILGTGRPIRY